MLKKMLPYLTVGLISAFSFLILLVALVYIFEG